MRRCRSRAGKLAFDAAVPVGVDSLFRIYSMTKPITGMAAMMLVDEGKIGLDQPISDFLPKFAKMQVQVTPDGSITDLKPAETAITLRHLLARTAGLGYTGIMPGGPDPEDASEAARAGPRARQPPADPGAGQGPHRATASPNLPTSLPKCRWSTNRARGSAIRSASICLDA
jgi:CubicO group peptidase (beta-lactamase class C family)